MNTDLTSFEPYDSDKALRVIIEAPRGSSLKLEDEPKIRIFTVARELPLGTRLIGGSSPVCAATMETP